MKRQRNVPSVKKNLYIQPIGRPPRPASSTAAVRFLWVQLLTVLLLTAVFAIVAPVSQAAPQTQESTEDSPQAESQPGEENQLVGEEAEPKVEVVKARMAGTPGHRDVQSVRLLRDNAGRLAWAKQGEWIAYDQLNEKGLRELHLMRADGTGEFCFTCDFQEFRKVSTLNPAWHPSGDYLVFQVQGLPRRMRPNPARLAGPARGLHSELWLATRKGRTAWQITRVGEQGGALLDPYFSFEGDRLTWTERLESSRGSWGYWAPRIAEFKIKRGVPRLGKVKSYKPPIERGFVVSHGFTPNERGLWLSAVADPGQRRSGRDILRFNYGEGTVERLTSSPSQWDDLVSVGPRSDRLVWVSDRNIPRSIDQALPRRGDLWMMIEEEGRQERLTFFNDPASDHYLGEALIDDIAWSPEGDQLLVHVVSVERNPTDARLDSGLQSVTEDEEGSVPIEEGIYRLELGPAFER